MTVKLSRGLRYSRVALRERAVPLLLGGIAFGLAFIQRPGLASSDTKIDLHVDPFQFLARVTSAWSSTGDLGHVQGGQYGGYLFPMGPFFAFGHLLGLPAWITHRLWLGLLLALAAWGTVRLLDALLPAERGLPHLIAGLFVVLNPYVVVFSNRTSVTLLGYVVLPWLLLAVVRGVRDPKGWWWPALFALLVTAMGGGVNVAVPAFVLLGPLLLLVYEPLSGSVSYRAAIGFAWRCVVLTAIAALWWLVPVLTQVLFGIDFLQFTEQPGTIWDTPSVSESLRLMGYWVSYIGIGYGNELIPYFGDSPLLLFNPVVVVAMLLVPALALGGFLYARRFRYGPFFLALALLGVLIMSAGFPDGKPLRLALNFAYNNISAGQFLRTTYKAGPLLVFGLAGLIGYALAALQTQLRLGDFPLRRFAVAMTAFLLLALSAWPLVRGRAVDDQMLWRSIPSAWQRTGEDLDRSLKANTRAVVLPGQLFAFYRWGGTVDPVLPVLTERPVALRNIVPYADLRSADLLWTVDLLVQQQRLLPGQLDPLLRLIGAGAVIVGADDSRLQSGALQPLEAAKLLGQRAGLRQPARSYGPVRDFHPAAGNLGGTLPLPQVRRYDVGSSQAGVVRVRRAGPQTVVDGSASGLAALAAFRQLPDQSPLFYAADLSSAEIKAAARRGAEVVISDSNRRRVFVTSQLQQNTGATVGPEDRFSEDAALMNPFPSRGSDAQTVMSLEGLRYLRMPFNPGRIQFPEHRPYSALDGSLKTTWLADGALPLKRRWLDIGFLQPRDIPYVDVHPHNDFRARTTQLEIAGRVFNLRAGWQRIKLGLKDVKKLRVRIADTVQAKGRFGAPGGLDELRIPGLSVRESLRPPVLLERALRGERLDRAGLTYLFERTSADDPRRVSPVVRAPHGRSYQDRRDAETGLHRVFTPPAARSYTASAWVSTKPDSSDDDLDRLAGYQGKERFLSRSRFQGRPEFRASSAFDGSVNRAWVGAWVPSKRGSWISWQAAKDLRFSRLKLLRPTQKVRFPTVVRLHSGSQVTSPLEVQGDGSVVLPKAFKGRKFRLEILEAKFPPGLNLTGRERQRRAVGIGELRVSGMRPVRVPRSGPIASRCGDLSATVAGRILTLRVAGTVRQLDRSEPLRAVHCGPQLKLPARRTFLQTKRGPFRFDLLRLHSRAPNGSSPGTGGGQVVNFGSADPGSRSGVRVSLNGPSWLVLGESYNGGWRATCNGRSLGRPTPIDGYANGWRVSPDCREVSFFFAPNRIAYLGYAVSGPFCLLLLALLVVGRRRRLRGGEASIALSLEGAAVAAVEKSDPLPFKRALLYALPVAMAVGFVFALRAGLVALPLVTFLLWKGWGAGRLTKVAALLLGVFVPLLYVVFPPTDRGGYNFRYPLDQVASHWVATAALLLLGLALWRTAFAWRRLLAKR